MKYIFFITSFKNSAVEPTFVIYFKIEKNNFWNIVEILIKTFIGEHTIFHNYTNEINHGTDILDYNL